VGVLDGKVAIITGAARGQGAAEARSFSAEGARVVLTDVLDAEGGALVAEIGGGARFVHHDVSQEREWAAVVHETLRAFGRVDILVNNAGIHWIRPLEEETTEGFERIWRVNLLGPFLGMRAVVAPMRAAGGGSIVNISSTAGMVGLPGHSAYGAAKWGLRGLTKTAALELGTDSIRVNSVHPGAIKTAMLPADRDELGEGRFAGLPLGRAGEATEVAALVTFLASDASAYMTGAELVIDGGSTAGPAPRGRR